MFRKRPRLLILTLISYTCLWVTTIENHSQAQFCFIQVHLNLFERNYSIWGTECLLMTGHPVRSTQSTLIGSMEVFGVDRVTMVRTTGSDGRTVWNKLF